DQDQVDGFDADERGGWGHHPVHRHQSHRPDPGRAAHRVGIQMTDNPRKPAWWMLYAVVPMMGGLVLVEARASCSPGWHKAVQIGIILFVYGLVWVWLRANDSAMPHDSATRAPLFREPRADRHAPT